MSKRKCLSLQQKLEVLNEVDKGFKKKDVATKFGIPSNSLSTIIKNRESILKLSGEINNKRKRARTCLYEDVNDAVYKWVQMIRERNLPISGPLIQEKALEYAKSLGHSDFQASIGWLDKLKQRIGLVQKTISGESAAVNEDKCLNWRQTTIKKILENYKPKDIFNGDETGLFYKCLPNKTLTFKEDKCFGGKHSKERVTLLVVANMTGDEKIKLLLIGKSKTPRCFKGLKSFETDYENNKNSWMTKDLFENWILKFDKEMLKQKRKVAMLIDNCPAHPTALELKTKLKNIEMFYFPPNTTSKLQPMDQGIIKNLKLHYKKRILKKNITAIEKNEAIEKIVDLRTCMTEISKAWEYDVKETTIQNSFLKAGFKGSEYVWEEDDDVPLAELQETWQKLKDQGSIEDDVTIEEFIEVDEGLAVADYNITDDAIIESVKEKYGEDTEEDHEDDESEYPRKPSNEEMIDAFEVIRRGLQTRGIVPDEVFRSLHRCEIFYEHSLTRSRNNQQHITDYFSSFSEA